MNKSSERVVEPELLDVLPPADQRARRSRLDLRRLNWWMSHPQKMARALRENLDGICSPRITELGAGDGHFLLTVAHHLHSHCPNAEVTLVDRLDAFEDGLSENFQDLGWRAHTEITSVAEWLLHSKPASSDAIVCNLFLHQFQVPELTEMLRQSARCARVFVALEPRRSWLARFFGSFLWVIRCGPVTRHDAGISIRAGFSGPELSAIWPDKKNWELTEHSAGVFSHLFVARRKD